MTRYVTKVAFTTVLMLGGCQYNGTYDFSNLIKEGERIVITKEAVEDEVSYYIILRNTEKKISRRFYEKYIDEGFPSLTTLNSEYGNEPGRVGVRGESGLFIEYNQSRADNSDFYIVSGGIPTYDDYDYTTIPSGILGYSGKVVSIDKTYVESGFSSGTVKAEVNFNTNKIWVEFAGTGSPELDLKYENIDLEPETGKFAKKGSYNRDAGLFISEYDFPEITGDEFHKYRLYGYLLGPESVAMKGAMFIEESIQDVNSSDPDYGIFTEEHEWALFVAEKDN